MRIINRQVILAGLLICLHFGLYRVVRGEGAGSTLGDVGQCVLLWEKLLDSPVGLINGTDPIIQFNSTIYGQNRTHYLLTVPDLPNATLIIDEVQQLGTGVENVAVLTQDDAEALIELADTAVEEGVSGDELEKSLGDLDLGSDTELVLDVVADPFNVVPVEAELVALNETTLEEALALGGAFGEILELIADEVRDTYFPASCAILGLQLNSSAVDEQQSTASNDTITTLTTDNQGNEVTTTCTTTLSSLENQTMRVFVIGDETEAYIQSDGRLGGYIGKTFDRVRGRVSQLTFDFYNLTLDALQEYPLSPWSACIWDIHKGRLDMCLGEFYDTEERRQLTEMSAVLKFRQVGLVVKKTGTTINFSGLIEPFAAEVWACILATVFIFGALLWIVSFRRNTNNYAEGWSESKRLGHSVHLSIQSLFGAALVNDLDEPIHAVYWLSAGYALFVMVIIAAYTANLAALLLVEKNASTYNSLEDLAVAGLAVCVPQALTKRLTATRQPFATPLATVEVATVTEALDNIDAGKCAGAIIQTDALQFASGEHCESKIVVGIPIFQIPTAIPVRMRYEGLISKHISSMRENSVIDAYYDDMVEELAICNTFAGENEDVEQDGSLTLIQMMPLFVVVSFFFVIGIAVHVWELIAKRRRKRSGKAGSPQPGSEGSSHPTNMDTPSSVTCGPDIDSKHIHLGEASGALDANAFAEVMHQLQVMQESHQRMEADLRNQLQQLMQK